VSRFRAAAASLALAAALVAVALGARGGTALERTGAVELALIATGAVLVCAAVLTARGGPLYGGWVLAAFAALAGLTALSIGWSISPELSYTDAGLMLAYLSVLAGAIAAARLAPSGALTVLRGVLLASVAIAAYGLAARVWPATFDEGSFGGRIGLPFDYWNALAGAAAIGVVPALWLGARRSGGLLGRALAYPAAGLLIATVLIAQSRGALLGGAIACALWIAFVPLRLRSIGVLVLAAVGAAPVAAWALSKDAFRLSLQPLSAREAVAGDFGLLLLLMVIGLLAAGLVVEAVRAHHSFSLRGRARAGIAIAAVVALVPLVALTSLAASDRGLGGSISDRFDDLTSESADLPTGGGRLGSVSSTRSTYWREAWDAFEEKPAFGLGAGSFEIARLKYRDDGFPTSRAHGFVPQTLADLGVAGVIAGLALLAAWLAAAARATGLDPRRRHRAPAAWTTDRTALVALALAALTFGVQGMTDWTWYVPGVAVLALVAAGYVAGHRPPRRLGAVAAPPPPPAGDGRPKLAPARLLAAAGVLTLAAACAWTVWQPVGSARAVTRAYELIESGDPAAALAEAETARDRNPYSNDTLYAESEALLAQGRDLAALRALRTAALDHPREPGPWIRLAGFALYTLDSPRDALALTKRAYAVDPYSQAVVPIRDAALRRLGQPVPPKP
jgi:hypothetical protein